MSEPLRVGITGGIGSGKSAVTARLEAYGIEIVDADVEARAVVEVGSEALAAIADRFGDSILLDDGSLNRAALRKIVFADDSERLWLEALTHPRIGARIDEQLTAAQSPYVVLSSPLLLEGSQKSMVEFIVVVDVPESLQLSRTMARDNNDEALVRSIMAAQLSREDRRRQADAIIDNSGSLEDLQTRVDDLHTRLTTIATERAAHKA